MSKVDITSLFYDEERADVAEWFAARGWTVQGADALELAATYGVEIPELPEDVVEARGFLSPWRLMAYNCGVPVPVDVDFAKGA